MKRFLALGPQKPLDRATAWGCLTANISFPGLGSLAAGRRTGYWQMLLGLCGVVLSGIFTGWMVWTWLSLERLPDSWPEVRALLAGGKTFLWLGAWGFAAFAAGWSWALATGVAIVRESKRSPPPALK